MRFKVIHHAVTPDPVRKTYLSLVAIAGIICFSPAQASPVGKITALESSVWLQHGEIKSRLGRNSEINTGDRVITSDTGKVEMLLWSNVSLQLETNSEIEILADKNAEVADSDKLKALYLHTGRTCINYNSPTGAESKFSINIGNSVIAAIHDKGHICISREDGLSSVRLFDGSVQLTHTVDPYIIVLNESGTEFRIKNDGYYEILAKEIDGHYKLDNEDPAITETDDEIANAGVDASIVDHDTMDTDTEKGVESKPNPDEQTPAYIYTVYLFSTRSEEAAKQLNVKFQEAGHASEIVASEADSVTRYRLVVSGFDSLQSAKEYSRSIVGKFGVADTWIGKRKQSDQVD